MESNDLDQAFLPVDDGSLWLGIEARLGKRFRNPHQTFWLGESPCFVRAHQLSRQRSQVFRELAKPI